MPTTYEDLYDKDGTIYKKGVDGGLDSPYAKPEDLAADLGIGNDQIDWGQINPYAPPVIEKPPGEITQEDIENQVNPADLLGDTPYDEELAGAEENYYETFSPEYIQQTTEKAEADVLKKFQAEIDILEAERAEARSRIVNQYGEIGKSRQGTSTAIQARRGLVGSTFGSQQKSNLASQTQREQDAAIAYSSALYSERKRALMGDVRTAQSKEAKLRYESAQLGSQAKIEEIRGRKERQDKRVSDVITNMLGMETDVNDTEFMEEIAEGLGISVNDLLSRYETAKTEAEQAEEKRELELKKLEAGGQTKLSPGEKLYDTEGNLIAEGEGKTITLSEGQILYDGEGNVIARGKSKSEENNTQVVELSDGSKILINKDTGETIKRFEEGENINDFTEEGIYNDEIEFGYNEKIDISKLPKLGGKQITNKTARQGNLPYGVTDKQADWIIEHRIGNIQFQQLKSKDVDSLNDLVELREDIDEIRELKEKVDTGKASAPIGRTLRDWFGKENKDFNQLEIKSGKQLAEFIKEISGAAVSEQEAQRLAKLVPNIEMQDGQFIIALDDLEDGLNGLIETKINQFDLEDENQLIKAIRGVSNNESSTEPWSEEGGSGGIWDFSLGGSGTPTATTDTKKVAQAIGQYESGGNYKSRGKVIPSGQYKGERAMGKYQIMPGNLPSWSKEAIGRIVSEQEFMNSPKIQDQIAEYKMGKIFAQYGNVEDVASVWFSGRPVARAGNAKDVLGTSVPQYIKNVRSIYNRLS